MGDPNRPRQAERGGERQAENNGFQQGRAREGERGGKRWKEVERGGKWWKEVERGGKSRKVQCQNDSEKREHILRGRERWRV